MPTQAKRIQSIEFRRMVDGDPDTSYLEQEGFEDRRESYHNGVFEFIGIRADASIVVAGVCQTVSSGGLWGIESDSDESYLKEIEQEELSQMRDILHDMGFSKRAIAAAVKEMV
jgi:hypothetical protein